MELLAAFPVYADHYQFYISDSEAEFCPLRSKADGPIPGVFGDVESGYATNGSSTFISTGADLNWHWMELFHSDATPDFGASERVTVVLMTIPSGEVAIACCMGSIYGSAIVAPSVYTVYVLGFSLGRDDVSEIPNPKDWPKDRSNAELAALTEYEHYRIVFVPGDITNGNIGLLRGTEQ